MIFLVHKWVHDFNAKVKDVKTLREFLNFSKILRHFYQNWSKLKMMQA